MSSAPPVPPEQRSPGANTEATSAADATETQGLDDRRDRATQAQSGQPGDSDVNKDQQGRFGDINQNTHHQGYQQDR